MMSGEKSAGVRVNVGNGFNTGGAGMMTRLPEEQELLLAVDPSWSGPVGYALMNIVEEKVKLSGTLNRKNKSYVTSIRELMLPAFWLVVENPFVKQNIQSALKVGKAAGETMGIWKGLGKELEPTWVDAGTWQKGLGAGNGAKREVLKAASVKIAGLRTRRAIGSSDEADAINIGFWAVGEIKLRRLKDALPNVRS